ncbi:hypothetical protein ENSA5_02490 [Enhygromyxa salina]|uniref:Uncharacterized protein n=1 Tax=Enhygromyxa salina TaxID=215803 RepID=A0A2S9YJZ6_9BACT|nr:hypothetical protein [Enhygromyxa salina]PRQ05429.1 hypothetical protein ENSA5_02490 [Enhygromyxa salina]
MSEAQTPAPSELLEPSEPSELPEPSGPRRGRPRWRRAPLPGWLVGLRRVVNVVFPLALGYALLLAAWPRDELAPPRQARHDELIKAMRQISLSQAWSMYAPNPGRGHFYMTLTAHDADGSVRELEESYMSEHGWGTAWAWRRSRLDIWQHAVTRKIDKTNRNRTWYLRGVCVREARRGYDVKRLEMKRVYRRIRSPERVREGKEVIGPPRLKRAQDGSCRVKIIRDMIATDRALREAGEGGASGG